MNLKATEKKVVEKIAEKELVDLATALGNITAPSGHEQPMADYVEQWLRTPRVSLLSAKSLRGPFQCHRCSAR